MQRALRRSGLEARFVSEGWGRALAGVEAGRPMIGTIIKPSVGLTPEYTANLVKTLADAGIDVLLVDLTGNAPGSKRYPGRGSEQAQMLKRDIIASGDQIIDAEAGFDQGAVRADGRIVRHRVPLDVHRR